MAKEQYDEITEILVTRIKAELTRDTTWLKNLLRLNLTEVERAACAGLESAIEENYVRIMNERELEKSNVSSQTVKSIDVPLKRFF